jgi:hypothetical protein
MLDGLGSGNNSRIQYGRVLGFAYDIGLSP